MKRPKRKLSAFSLSFLDIMSCGFGATVLLFLIIKHQIDANPAPVTRWDQSAEAMLLEEEVLQGERNLAELRNTLEESDQRVITAQGLANQIMKEIQEVTALSESADPEAVALEIAAAQKRIHKLEQQRDVLKADIRKTGDRALKVTGEGRRQYITGLKLDGKRSLILLDTSASMLDNTVVNILRFRNLRDERKRLAEKWRQSIRIVEWLLANLSVDSEYQLYLFNADAGAALKETDGGWLKVKDRNTLKKAVAHLKTIVPENGTNLERAFQSARRLRPAPDNIYLITDGLPTQGGGAGRGATIGPKQRLALFNKAVESLPARSPVHVILAPMEGDLQASFAFWQLSQTSNGSFISPKADWP